MVPPADLRYLKQAAPNIGGDSATGRALSFLQTLYESVAETLPDSRELETCDSVQCQISVKAKEVENADPYADALSNKAHGVLDLAGSCSVNAKKKDRVLKSVKFDSEKVVNQEERWLPPGASMKDYWEQMLQSVCRDPTDPKDPDRISFCQFWRVSCLVGGFLCVLILFPLIYNKLFVENTALLCVPASQILNTSKASAVSDSEVWHRHFRFLKFRSVSQHAVCNECLRHKLLLRQLGSFLGARHAQQSLYSAHLLSQYRDRLVYWSNRGASRCRNGSMITLICDSMDQSKFFFPRGSQSEFRSKELGGMVRPKAHITCCLIHGFCTIFTVSPANLRKDSSTMMDIVMHGLHILKADFGVDISRHHVSLQTDNTTREFKNNTCARMLGWLCAHRPFS